MFNGISIDFKLKENFQVLKIEIKLNLIINIKFNLIFIEIENPIELKVILNAIKLNRK